MNNSIYSDISKRTNGDIYIGVVGPVRTGKSTFIKKFMDTMVLPNIADSFAKERAKDELPQSAAGKTIMTTEPKFIPEEAVELSMENNINMRVRMIDCVGYIVPSSVGYIEEEQPRMVMTPWYDEEIPFNMAAEIGTKKVITEHSTIGLVITTDGSISSIPRDEYEEAEQRVIEELRELDKPFVVLMNCIEPKNPSTVALCQKLTDDYKVPVIPVNCLELTEEEITDILSDILYEFPLSDIKISYPSWINGLESDNYLKHSIFSSVRENTSVLSNIRSAADFAGGVESNEYIESVSINSLDLSTGSISIKFYIDNSHFYKILSDSCSVDIEDEKDLMNRFIELMNMKKEYERFNKALKEVEETGYGIVMPEITDLSLSEPEIMKQGGRYGVRLKAQAPSIHMIKCNTQTEVAPIVGSESQSQDLVMYLLKEFEENPADIWNTNIFGKSLHELVNEGLNNKLYRMPIDARNKFRETIERVINEGCNGLICIIL
ncbi:MAG: stage IV sporulation protein A [Acetobacter sp.]|nr:stage IV sporulation protein A [Bacteroides sp.]MCM1340533.1 stage IV sporulation protein A [Acetobacter sp.]MCM1433273.1 stage IV sporulation protein A [Clostridiales bacterium]